MTPIISNTQALNPHLRCADFIGLAERELSAFVRAVTQRFGPRQAELSADDWLRELTTREALPESTREWRLLTLRVIPKLASRVNTLSIANELIPA